VHFTVPNPVLTADLPISGINDREGSNVGHGMRKSIMAAGRWFRSA
jgi:hypothetical protein